MSTNLRLDDKLINHARRVGRHKTKRAAVTAALEEYVRYHEQLKVLALERTIEYDPAYDYKTERRRSMKRNPARTGNSGRSARDPSDRRDRPGSPLLLPEGAPGKNPHQVPPSTSAARSARSWSGRTSGVKKGIHASAVRRSVGRGPLRT